MLVPELAEGKKKDLCFPHSSSRLKREEECGKPG